MEQIVLETDCPYMAPEPVRGIRCDSSLIRYVGEYVASAVLYAPLNQLSELVAGDSALQPTLGRKNCRRQK